MKKKSKLIAFTLVLFLGVSCGSSRRDCPVSLSKWSKYDAGTVVFKNASPEATGAKIYNRIIPQPEVYIGDAARTVLSTLYFSPKDSIPAVRQLIYTLKEYDGISAKGGQPPVVYIDYSTKWVEHSFGDGNLEKLHQETKGILYHELTHAYQLEPQGIGNYGNSRIFWCFIEGMADAVRYINGGFTDADRPKGGNYMDGYRTTGFFLVWLAKTKDSNFLRKFNRSTLEVIPWSFDGAIQHVLGNQYTTDLLWKEYMEAMGDK